MKYEFIEHTADIKFKAYGKTIDEAFENAVLAMSEHLAMGKKVQSKKGKVVEVSGTDIENLLYNFLEEIIFLLDTERFIVARAEVTIRGNNLKAELFGDDAKNYEIDDIKAVTYSEMHVKKDSSGFEIQVVLDV